MASKDNQLEKWAKKHPVTTGFILVVLFVIFRKGLYFLFKALPQTTGLRILNEILDVIWPYMMVALFNQTDIFKKRGFFNTLFIGLPYLTLSIVLLVLNIISTAKEPGIEWYPLPMIIFSLLTGFAVGFREESIFRGTYINILADKYLKDRKGIYLTVVISAFFFGIMHMSNMLVGSSFISCLAQSLNAFFVGMMFAAVYLRGGSIWAMIFIHGLYDIAVSVPVFFTKTFGTDGLSYLAQKQEISFKYVIESNALAPIYIAITLYLLRKSKCEEIIKKFIL